MKAGATRTDQNRIKKYAADGMTAEQISKALAIKLEVVESFMPKQKKSSKKTEDSGQE